MTLLRACQALGTKSLFTKGGGGGSYLQTMNYSGIGVKLGKELLTKNGKETHGKVQIFHLGIFSISTKTSGNQY